MSQLECTRGGGDTPAPASWEIAMVADVPMGEAGTAFGSTTTVTGGGTDILSWQPGLGGVFANVQRPQSTPRQAWHLLVALLIPHTWTDSMTGPLGSGSSGRDF